MEEKPVLFFKFLTKDNHGSLSGFKWPVPVGGFPGEWVGVDGELVMCNNGIHVCEWKDVLAWLDARMYLVETEGGYVRGGDKLAFRRARLVHRVESWNDRTARLFAADCAERAAGFWVPDYGLDWNPADAIDVARRFANGDANDQELRDAWSSAREAARMDFSWAARAVTAAVVSPAWAAAESVVWFAQGAGRDAGNAVDAEREWQLARLDHYVGDELRAYSAMGGSE